FFDSARAIVPIISRAFGTPLFFVILSLLEAEHDAVDHFAPILKLNSATHQRQTRRPIFFGSARVLLGNRQIVKRGKRLAREFIDELPLELFVRELGIRAPDLLGATKEIRGAALFLNHGNILEAFV